MACFADINVSQGGVATYAMCGGIFNIHLPANLLRNLPVKKNCKLVKISQNYCHKSVARFFGPPCIWMDLTTTAQSLCFYECLMSGHYNFYYNYINFYSSRRQYNNKTQDKPGLTKSQQS